MGTLSYGPIAWAKPVNHIFIRSSSCKNELSASYFSDHNQMPAFYRYNFLVMNLQST